MVSGTGRRRVECKFPDGAAEPEDEDDAAAARAARRRRAQRADGGQ
jgi:hypothetical protein